MSLIVRPHTYPDGVPARPDHANANETTIYAEINGNLDWDNILAALINAANGFLKLDASALVPLAQIPTTLTGKDADTLDGSHLTDIVTIPSGVIVMWSGLLANIPSGWSLCNGAGSTPDLRDKFVRGAASGADPGATGGSDTHTHTVGTLSGDSGGAHTHSVDPPSTTSGTGGSHTHSVNPPTTTTSYETRHYDPAGPLEAGNYYHTHTVNIPSFTSGSVAAHSHSVNIASFTSGSAGTHTHTISGSVASSSNMPAYFALAFIMKD